MVSGNQFFQQYNQKNNSRIEMQISEEAKTEIKPADEEMVYSEYVNISKKPGITAPLKQLSEHSSEFSEINNMNTHLKKVQGVQHIMNKQV